MNSDYEITIGLVPDATDEVRALIGELDQILSAEYPPKQRHGLRLDQIFQPDVRFFLARFNSSAVGCGGVAFFADFAEVKRMYVRDGARGRGVAQALLSRIEAEARAAGFGLLKLETGVRQTAALRFYRRAGFRDCVAFGAYATMARRPPPPACSWKSYWQRDPEATGSTIGGAPGRVRKQGLASAPEFA